MSTPVPISFAQLHAVLKAAGETTRLRVLALLGEAELTVSDLTEILRQSQPRISRHLKLLSDAGLIERFREGSWAFHRCVTRGNGAKICRALLELVDHSDPVLARDRERLAQVRTQRQSAAQSYFRDRKSTRLNSSHVRISYAVFCLKKKKKKEEKTTGAKKKKKKKQKKKKK